MKTLFLIRMVASMIWGSAFLTTNRRGVMGLGSSAA